MLAIGCAVLFLAESPAQAAVAELDLMPIPSKQPRWAYGAGAFQVSAWSAGYTSWGSLGYAVDLLLSPDFEVSPSMVAIEFEPVLSVPSLLGTAIPEGYVLTDFGVTAQLKNGLLNERYQSMPLSGMLGATLEFGGSWINGLSVDLMWRASLPYTESYEIAFVDVDGTAGQTTYEDEWPIAAGPSFGLSWFHTWSMGRTELFTRGFADVWQQRFVEVEQWPEDRPGELSAGPTWLQESSPWRVLTQPQVGIRFGKTLAYVSAVEVELTHQVYLVPEDDLGACVDPIVSSEGVYCLRREGFTAQVGPIFGLRF